MDFLYGRIFNIWLYGWIIAGLLIEGLNKGVHGLSEAVIGMAVPFIILFAFFTLGMIGAGDIKLFMALGAWIRAEQILNIMMMSFLIAGIYAMIVLVRKRELLNRFQAFFYYIKDMSASGRRTDYRQHSSNRYKIRLGIFVFIAVILNLIGVCG